VLDDDARRLGKYLDAFPCRVAVGNVVVGKLLALELSRGRDGSRGGHVIAIKRRLLMRILTVTHVLQLGALPIEPRRKRVHGARRIT
jgi:hypothetical protein